MTRPPLFLALLVLLHAGLVAAHAHEHAGFVSCHALPDAAHPDEPEPDGDHDACTLCLPDAVLSGPAPHAAVDPGVPTALLDIPHFGTAGASPFPLGLPPATAGPHRPLYVTFCTFRN
jgi:hypothetical protein